MVDVSDPTNPVLIAEFPYPEVPEDFPLSKLGFLIIAIFDTRAQHIFHFNKGNQFYSLPIPGEDLLDGEIDVYKVKLSDDEVLQ